MRSPPQPPHTSGMAYPGVAPGSGVGVAMSLRAGSIMGL